MLQIIEHNDLHIWQGDAVPVLDAIALLSVLEPAWDVEEAVDPAGERSIVVFSTVDDLAMPAFILFEREGTVVVGTVRNDAWESERCFPSREGAAAAIVTEAARVELLGAGSGGHHFERCA